MQYPVLNKDSIEANITETKAKIPLLIKGNWHVPGYGLMSVTDEYIDTLTNNFKSNVLGFKPYATLGHPTDSPDPASIDGDRKRGDLEDIVKEGNIVYGIYSINKETYDLLKNGEYEYSSPEIQQNFKDKQSGKVIGPTLLRTALTNAPFMPFNDSKAVLLSQKSNEEIITPMFIKLSTNVTINSDETTETVPTEVIIEENKPTIIETKMTLQEEVKAPESPKVESSSIDLEAILGRVVEAQQKSIASTIEIVTNKFNESLEAINSKTAESVNAVMSTVQELSNKVESLATKAQEIDKTKEYITALSSSEKAKELNFRLNSLFETQRVNPAAISLAKSIITSTDSNSVVKLSSNAGEKEVSLEDSILELVKLSANIMPQAEQAGATGEAKKESYFQSVIQANLEKAKAKAKK